MGLFKKKKNPERISEEKKSPLDEMDPSIRPGGVFMVQLLMKEKCEMPSLQRMTEVLERHIGKVEAAEPDDNLSGSMKGIALFAAMDHIAKFSNGEGPVQVSVMPCDTFHPENIDEMRRSQMWDCLEDRDRILSECKYCVFANDMLTGALDPLERADFDMDYLEALLELFPTCEAVYSLNTGKLILADLVRSREVTGLDRYIRYIVNARFFNISGTNDHVVDGASTITVRTKDGESYEATLLGTDSKTDIAVLRIEADGLTPAILGDSDALSVGEYAMAIGNPLGQLGGTVTDGIVSALSREVNVNGENMTLLQTNAAINPGNSGGGLFNEKGELIGIVNAKSSNGASSSGASIEGLGFAIPVNTVKNSVQELLDYGYVRGRPALGITLLNVQNAQDAFQYRVSRLGVYVQSVTEGGASEKAGVQVGDCIIALGDVAVSTHAEVKSQLNNYAVGDTVQLQVIRDGRTLTLDVTLEEFKPDAES